MVLPLLVAAAAGLLVWQRELWFDEALTLTNFMLPLKLEEIYFNYTPASVRHCDPSFHLA